MGKPEAILYCPHCESDQIWTDQWNSRKIYHCYQCTYVWDEALPPEWAKIDGLFHDVLNDPGE